MPYVINVIDVPNISCFNVLTSFLPAEVMNHEADARVLELVVCNSDMSRAELCQFACVSKACRQIAEDMHDLPSDEVLILTPANQAWLQRHKHGVRHLFQTTEVLPSYVDMLNLNSLTLLYSQTLAEFFPELPDTLEVLRIQGNRAIGQHVCFSTNLPDSLRILSCRDCGIVVFRTGLPSNLTQLDLRGLFIPQDFPELPSTLTVLRINDCFGFGTSLPQLPRNLEILECSRCIGLLALPILPSTLAVLRCSMCDFTSLPDLPATLKILDCSGCSELNVLPILPNDLRVLDCSVCIALNSCPGNLPSGLRVLDCSRCYFGALPTTLPSTLRTLRCAYCRLQSLPPLPSTLKILDCSSNRLRALPDLPSGLVVLRCRRNPTLTNRPALPVEDEEELEVLEISDDDDV